MKNIYRIILGLVAIYIGYVVYVIIDFLTHPEKYIYYSAPWYTGILVQGICLIIAIVIILLLYWIIKKIANKKK